MKRCLSFDDNRNIVGVLLFKAQYLHISSEFKTNKQQGIFPVRHY